MSNEPIDMPKITFQYGVFMILLGVIFSFTGLIVHDYLREKFEDPEEDIQESE